MSRHISRTWWAVCLSATLAVAACGGGGGGGERADDEDASDRTTTTEASDTSESTATTAPGTPPSGEGVPAPGEPGAVATQLEIDRTFTGEGSEEFCAQARALQQSVSSGDASSLDEATVTGQMAALAPPAEIAEEWGLMVSVQQSLADGEAQDLAELDQAQLDAYGQASVVIAAYLGDVCQLSLVD